MSDDRGTVEKRRESTGGDGQLPGGTDEESKPLGQESPEIVGDAADIGGKRLDRPPLGDVVTSVIGGMSIGFGVLAMAVVSASLGGDPAPSAAHLVGSLAYPIAFVIIVFGKSELFTENFLLPVTGVLERRGSIRQLLALWGVSLVSNLAGAAIFAFLISRAGILDAATAEQISALATDVAGYPFWTALIKALFAGWLMTILTWLMLAVEDRGAQLVVVWLIGTMIVLGEFTHVIISGAEILIAVFLGAPVSITGWLGGTFGPILAGNVLGGVLFVTMLHYVQAIYDTE